MCKCMCTSLCMLHYITWSIYPTLHPLSYPITHLRLYFSSFTVSSWTISFEISFCLIHITSSYTDLHAENFSWTQKVCTLITSNIHPSMWLPSWAQTMEGNHQRKVSWISKWLLPMTIQNLTGHEMCPTFCQRQIKAYFQVSTHLSNLFIFTRTERSPETL